MAVKEKVRLCLDLSCLTLYWTCMYALNSLKSRWTLFTFSSSVMLFKKTLNAIFHSTLVQCMHVLICNRVFSATSWPVNTSSLVNSARTVRKAFCKRTSPTTTFCSGWGRTQQSNWWMISVFITSRCMPFVNPVHTWAPDSVISSLFSIADIQYSNVRQGQVWQALSSPLHGNYARPGGQICLILLEDESATHLWLVALSGVSHGTGERLRVMDVCRGLFRLLLVSLIKSCPIYIQS